MLFLDPAELLQLTCLFCFASLLEPRNIRTNDPEDEPAETHVGRCDMHLANLAAGLALSLVERKENKKVINYWNHFQDLYKSLKVAFKYLFDKKNKRFGHSKMILAKISQPVIMASLPPSTRVAGALPVHQQSLRLVHAIR